MVQVRSDFGSLNKKINGKPVIYFDNACQTLRPRQVIEAIKQYYEKYPACAGRSAHKLATRVTKEIERVREGVAKFIGAKKPSEVVFTRNTTEGINLVAKSLDLKEGDEVVISDKEHNSNLVPWQMLQKQKGIKIKITPSKADNTFDLEAFEKLLTDKTKLVSIVATSNLDGVSNPIKEIVKLSHKKGALVLIDGAQWVPHQLINVSKLDVDFLAFSGHKMLGPSGIGVLYGKYQLLEGLQPFMVGGDTVERTSYKEVVFLPPPEKFEAGLQNYAGIIGLGAAVEYLEQIGLEAIKQHEIRLNKIVTEEISRYNRVKILGPVNPDKRGGIVSFMVEGVSVHQLALMLDEMANIMIRSGQHCVHSWFNHHGIKGSDRISFYLYNTIDEVGIFIDTFKKIMRVI